MRLPNRILFVGAHCDDIELFAGGLLARAALSGRRIGILVFSDHSGVVEPTAAAQARAELAENIAWLSSSNASLVHHKFNFLPGCQGAFERERGRIYSALEVLRNAYDLVVTHASSDTNQDHQQVTAEARRVFKAHATLLGGEFPNNDVGTFSPSVYIGLSAQEVDAKVRLVSRYKSQAFGGRPYLDESVIRSLARVRGSQIREPAAEAYEVLARVVVPAESSGAPRS